MRHFLTLKDFSKAELYEIITLAFVHKHAKSHYRDFVPPHLHTASLRDKNVALIFEKPSTRTRVSFEAGINQLGGRAIVLMGKDTQIGRGEPISDTARVLSGMVDMVMVRTFCQETLEELARFSTIPVINGLTDSYHPAQVLADVLTMLECGFYLDDFAPYYAEFTGHNPNAPKPPARVGSPIVPAQVLADVLTMLECGFYLDDFAPYYAEFTGHNPNAPKPPARVGSPIVAYIGDGNNMAHSWLNCAAILGLEFRLATPKGYEAKEHICASAVELAKHSQATITYANDPIAAVRNAHIIITDTWVSMGQEEQKQRKLRDFAGFCVDSTLMGYADSKAIFLHCLPAYRGYEVSEEVIESAQSKVWLEAHNRLYIQQGIMLWLLAQSN